MAVSGSIRALSFGLQGWTGRESAVFTASWLYKKVLFNVTETLWLCKTRECSLVMPWFMGFMGLVLVAETGGQAHFGGKLCHVPGSRNI